jgi:hypothetical protein
MNRPLIVLLVAAVVLLLASLFASGLIGADTATPGTVTPTDFNYLPFVAKNFGTPRPTSTPTGTPTPTRTPTATMTPGPGVIFYVCGCGGGGGLSPAPCPTPDVLNSCVFQGQLEWMTTLSGDIAGDMYSFELYLSSPSSSSSTTYMADIVLHQGQNSMTLASTSFEVPRSQYPGFRSATVRGVDPSSTTSDRLGLRLRHNASFGQIYWGLVYSRIVIPPVQ